MLNEEKKSLTKSEVLNYFNVFINSFVCISVFELIGKIGLEMSGREMGKEWHHSIPNLEYLPQKLELCSNENMAC